MRCCTAVVEEPSRDDLVSSNVFRPRKLSMKELKRLKKGKGNLDDPGSHTISKQGV